MFISKALILSAFVAASASHAWAWGCTGHEVVALIARTQIQKLDASNGTQVASVVERLLATQTHDYHGRFCSDLGLDPIAYFATWADDHRGVDPSTGPWHFWDIPLSVKTATADQYCDKGCVIQALENNIAIIRDGTQDDATRGAALLYVIHFMGDLHQPLHTEDNNDRGGNCVPTTFLNKKPKPAGAGGNYTPNLHAIWDTQLVENIGGITRSNQDAGNEIQKFAATLFDQFNVDLAQASLSSIDLVGWANEAHQIAIDVPYSVLKPPIAAIGDVEPVATCADENTSAKYLAKHEVVTAAYVQSVQTDIERQLSRAGGRLAAVLYSSLKEN